jgi:hypothetical protein
LQPQRLGVIARTSAMRYNHGHPRVQHVAADERYADRLAYVYALPGKTASRGIHHRRLAEQRNPAACSVAAIHLALGNTSQALMWLERAR